MKKKIVLALLAVVLLLAGLGGGVYAKIDHGYDKGDKLVGLGGLGTLTFSLPGGTVLAKQQHDSLFRITNPDCVNEITITRMSIIRYDGSLVYQGPYIYIAPDLTREIYTRPMEPHEMWALYLSNYMYTGLGADPANLTDPANWLGLLDARNQPLASYTVEIFWQPTSKKSACCPLTGWWRHEITRFGPPFPGPSGPMGTEVSFSHAENQMVNMTQEK